MIIKPTPHPPKSATNIIVSFFGLCALLVAITILRYTQLFHDQPHQSALFIIGIFSASIILLELCWQKSCFKPSTNIKLTQNNPSFTRTGIKLIGLVGSIAFIATLYWLFPEYHGDFYDNFFDMIRLILFPWILLSIPYFYWVDKHSVDPHDGYWCLGMAICFKWDSIDISQLKQHLLGWLVKGFFLPLMFTYMCNDLEFFIDFDFVKMNAEHLLLNSTIDFLYFIDVTIATAGYLLSLRLIDTHIRSSEPTLLGWTVALICYQPFYSLVERNYLAYSPDHSWSDKFADYPLLYALWGTVILSCVFVYVWSTVVFGLRFSNLTNRGIITCGPYRWTKHPAYIAKNLSWWMTAAPFISDGSWSEALRQCLLLSLVSLCYYLRARTEERHLLSDPEYVAYFSWMRLNGIFSGFKKNKKTL
jgi:protein-S-isoprenylcysteine O-methyltransferase Ste14